MNQSELLQSRIIDANAILWERIVAIGHNVPSPYSGVLALFSLLSPEELNQYQSGMCISGVLKTTEMTTRLLASPLGPKRGATDSPV